MVAAAAGVVAARFPSLKVWGSRHVSMAAIALPQPQKIATKPPRTIVIDTETTGLHPRPYQKPSTDAACLKAWEACRIVQFAWAIYEEDGQLVKKACHTVRPDGYTIPAVVAAIHGITTEIAMAEGIPISVIMESFRNDILAENVKILVAHNIRFDDPVVQAELLRLSHPADECFAALERRCTMLTGTLPGKRWPKLADLYFRYFNVVPVGCHRADSDVEFCSKIYFAMVEEGQQCFRN